MSLLPADLGLVEGLAMSSLQAVYTVFSQPVKLNQVKPTNSFERLSQVRLTAVDGRVCKNARDVISQLNGVPLTDESLRAVEQNLSARYNFCSQDAGDQEVMRH